MKQKLKGFTLMEMMAVLAITGIFLMLCQSVYGIFRKMQIAHERQSEYMYDLAAARSVFQSDMEKSTAFFFSGKDELVLGPQSDGKQIRYRQIPEYLLRITDSSMDSIRFSGRLIRNGDRIEWQDSLFNLRFQFSMLPRSTARPAEMFHQNLSYHE